MQHLLGVAVSEHVASPVKPGWGVGGLRLVRLHLEDADAARGDRVPDLRPNGSELTRGGNTPSAPLQPAL
eukprot:5052465-Amphidinium_carterae.1